MERSKYHVTTERATHDERRRERNTLWRWTMRQSTLRLVSAMFISVFMVAGIADAGPFGWGRAQRDAQRPHTRLVNDRHLRRVRVRGVVERVSGQRCVVRTSSGRRVTVLLGPASYWEYRGYTLHRGSTVTVDSWYDPEDRVDVYFAGTIAGPGFSFSLTNGSGVPYWVEDYEYREEWVPTYEVYDVWYQPSYRYVVPPGHARSVPPGHMKKHHETHERHEDGHRHGRR